MVETSGFEKFTTCPACPPPLVLHTWMSVEPSSPSSISLSHDTNIDLPNLGMAVGQ